MPFTPLNNPFKNYPLVGAFLDNIQDYLQSSGANGTSYTPATPSGYDQHTTLDLLRIDA